ncbi:MAG: LuxR C-terminal-related transcriptional regulator [Dehalococcoidia bacterium]
MLMRDRLQMEFGWTPRQRQVLDLIVLGKSNLDIAELLGLSIAGVKWHVSEILSKLQAESRDEAAEYWRRHNGLAPRFARVFRGILGTAALKWLGAGAGVAVAGASAVLFILVREDDAPPPGPPPVAIAPSAEDRDDNFALLLEAGQPKWAAGEPITVQATLRYVGPGAGMTYYASGGGPIVFDLREVGGTRVFDGAATLEVRPKRGSFRQPLR